MAVHLRKGWRRRALSLSAGPLSLCRCCRRYSVPVFGRVIVLRRCRRLFVCVFSRCVFCAPSVCVCVCWCDMCIVAAATAASSQQHKYRNYLFGVRSINRWSAGQRTRNITTDPSVNSPWVQWENNKTRQRPSIFLTPRALSFPIKHRFCCGPRGSGVIVCVCMCWKEREKKRDTHNDDDDWSLIILLCVRSSSPQLSRRIPFRPPRITVGVCVCLLVCASTGVCVSVMSPAIRVTKVI